MYWPCGAKVDDNENLLIYAKVNQKLYVGCTPTGYSQKLLI